MPLTVSSYRTHMPRPSSQDSALAFGIVVIGFLITLVMGLMSEGVHHMDDLTHYLIARWAWHWPAYLLHDWGRPGFTVLYFLPAGAGWHAARAWSALLSAITAWCAFRIAHLLGIRRAWMVPLFLYLQPRFFTLALTTLTETAVAFYLTTSIYLALRRRWFAASAVLSVALTARYETVILVPVFALAAVRTRQSLLSLAPVLWAPLVDSLLGSVTGMGSLVSMLLRPGGSGTNVYGHGGWYEFFSRSLEAFGPAIAALGFAGLAATWRRGAGGMLVAGCAAVLFATHVLIRLLGLFDSGGYARFLVPVGPLWAISAVLAWNRLIQRDPLRRSRTALGVAGITVLLWMTMELQVYAARHSKGVASVAAEIEDLWLAVWAMRVSAAAVTIIAMAAWTAARWASPVTGRAAAVRVELFGTTCTAAALFAGWLGVRMQMWAQHSFPKLYFATAADLPRLANADRILFPCMIVALFVAVGAWLLVRAAPPAPAPTLIPMRLSLAALMALSPLALCGTLQPRGSCVRAEQELQWLREQGLGDRLILSAHPWVTYRTGRELPPGRPDFVQQIDAAPVGAIIMVDQEFAPYNERPPLTHDALDVRRQTFRWLHRSGDINGMPAFQVYEKIAADGDLTSYLTSRTRTSSS